MRNSYTRRPSIHQKGKRKTRARSYLSLYFVQRFSSTLSLFAEAVIGLPQDQLCGDWVTRKLAQPFTRPVTYSRAKGQYPKPRRRVFAHLASQCESALDPWVGVSLPTPRTITEWTLIRIGLSLRDVTKLFQIVTVLLTYHSLHNM